jgi:hypothetical protein
MIPIMLISRPVASENGVAARCLTADNKNKGGLPGVNLSEWPRQLPIAGATIRLMEHG